MITALNFGVWPKLIPIMDSIHTPVSVSEPAAYSVGARAVNCKRVRSEMAMVLVCRITETYLARSLAFSPSFCLH